jgi:hypothetical protein
MIWSAFMKPLVAAARLLLFLLFSGAITVASADVIDPFTAPQGPLTMGPGEEPTEQQATVQSSSVLGGIRVALPLVDDVAEAGSTATMVIGGGRFDCRVDFPSLGNPLNVGGCGSSYFRGAGPVFDLTGSSRFELGIQSVDGAMDLAILLTDTNGDASFGFILDVAPGQASIPFDELIPATLPAGVDLSLVDVIVFAVSNQEGQEGRVILTNFSTDGPITDGPVIPVGDDIVAEEVPGTYFNPGRDGEGCQLTLERDDETFILTCYFYADGEQFWVIGVGQMLNGAIAFDELTITSGAQYGDAFDPNDVVRRNWGSATMEWSDCNNAALELRPIVSGYEGITLDLTRIVPTTCGGGGLQGDSERWMGAFYDPNRDGEGFHLGVEVGEIFVMTWYTYLNGQQVWMIGTGTRNGQRVVFSDVVITSGAGFGSQFDPADVVKEPFGEIVVDFSDCNNFTAAIDSQRPEFQDLVLNVTKIVPGTCP